MSKSSSSSRSSSCNATDRDKAPGLGQDWVFLKWDILKFCWFRGGNSVWYVCGVELRCSWSWRSWSYQLQGSTYSRRPLCAVQCIWKPFRGFQEVCAHQACRSWRLWHRLVRKQSGFLHLLCIPMFLIIWFHDFVLPTYFFLGCLWCYADFVLKIRFFFVKFIAFVAFHLN